VDCPERPGEARKPIEKRKRQIGRIMGQNPPPPPPPLPPPLLPPPPDPDGLEDIVLEAALEEALRSLVNDVG
jgi:hypothetical protein